MKKILTFLLATMMLLSLAACEKDDPTTTASKPNDSAPTSSSTATPTTPTTPSQPAEPDMTPQEKLEAAGDKLRNASSFLASMDMEENGEKNPLVYNFEIMQKRNEDGAVVCLITVNDEEILGMLAEPSFKAPIFDAGFGIDIMCRNEMMFDEFFNLNSTIATDENGITTYLTKGITPEQGTPVVGTILNSLSADAWCDISFAVDATGNLENQILSVYMPTEGDTMCITITISYANIVEPADAASQDWSKILTTIDDVTFYHYFSDDYYASYELNEHSRQENDGAAVFRFAGVFRNNETITEKLPVYEVKAQIENLPVYVDGGHFSSIFPNFWAPSRLVIPVGVKFTDRPIWENYVRLFFADTKENVTANFEDGYKDEPGAYYAGEWEYVDGIPTPIE